MLLSAISLAFSISSAVAYPRVYQRQAPSAALPSIASASVIDTPSSALPSGPLPIAPGGPEPLPVPSASASASEEIYPAYPCPADQFLTYVEEQRTYPFSFTVLTASGLTNWSGAPQFGPDVTGSGNDIGSSRTRTTVMLDGDLTETLVNFTSTADFYQDNSNLTETITIDNVTYSTWSQVFQVYSNSTGPTTTGEPAATVKLFTNACASDMMMAEMQLRGQFVSVLDNVNSLLQGQETRVPGMLNPGSGRPGPFTPLPVSDMPSTMSEMSTPSFMEPPSPVTPQTISPSAV